MEQGFIAADWFGILFVNRKGAYGWSLAGIRSGNESGRVSVVALEETRAAELLRAELLATEPLCTQSPSTDAPTGESGERLLGTRGTVLNREIVILVALISIAMAFCCAEGWNDYLRKRAMGYELYSW